MKRTAGFTLIELMIVVAIIAIIAAIAVPNLLRSRMSANEANATGAIRTISTSQSSFQTAGFIDNDGDGQGDFGTLTQLADPDGAGLTPPYIDSVLGGGTKQGYIYAVIVTFGNPIVAPVFTCTAIPTSIGQTGFRQFFVDETGVIRFTADGAAPTAAATPL